MLKINGTPQEFDDFWNCEINPCFDEIIEEINEVDLSNETKEYLQKILVKVINNIYGKIDDKFTNKWKYFSRSVDKVEW